MGTHGRGFALLAVPGLPHQNRLSAN